MTVLRLAYAGPPLALATGLGPRPGTRLENLPSLLVSFVYLKQWDRYRRDYQFRDWVMDSGAYSAWNSGRTIDLQEYIDVCAKRLAEDDKLVEVFALDVIDDWEAGMRNTEEMWRQGVPAIPTYHAGEPERVLLELAANYPKIAVSRSGFRRMGREELVEYLRNVFARVWPKKIHGLAFISREVLAAVPFHSVDASSWEKGPTRFATWRTLRNNRNKGRVSVRGSAHQLRDEVDWYLAEERWARARWRKQLAELEE